MILVLLQAASVLAPAPVLAQHEVEAIGQFKSICLPADDFDKATRTALKAGWVSDRAATLGWADKFEGLRQKASFGMSKAGANLRLEMADVAGGRAQDGFHCRVIDAESLMPFSERRITEWFGRRPSGRLEIGSRGYFWETRSGRAASIQWVDSSSFLAGNGQGLIAWTQKERKAR